MAKKASEAIYQLKVTLEGFRPPIWRRIQVPDDVTLAHLHLILQTAIGWTDYHLHMFTIDGVHYGEPSPEDWEPVKSEKRYRLNQLVGEGGRFRYEYDFGDSWEHGILVEKVLPADPQVEYPICIKGKMACPPEDVGGTWGYADFLEAIQNPEHPEHDEMLEWIGGEFDPQAFDLEEVNAALQNYR
ncbi:MAG: plasmid pRiA4b ORF-3 family protein [Anaerolineae bacterium]|nr:plasmid pRiA4b ORF-3 family protein [Anaerolineae bacterium]